jgi:hypothetical protein
MSTTFLFTERYGTLAVPMRERLGALAFPVSLALLAAGASWIFTLQASLGDAVAAALRSL